MKIKVFSFEEIIDFDDAYVNVLEVESPVLFSKLVHSFYNLIAGNDGPEEIAASQGETLLRLDKDAMIVTDYFGFDWFQKSIQNKLLSSIQDMIQSDFDAAEKISRDVGNLMIDVSRILCEYDFSLSYKHNIGVQDLLKLLSIKLDISSDANVLERLELLIDIIFELKICKLLVLVNVKQFLNQDDRRELIKYIKYKNINVLLLEQGLSKEKILDERIYRIDIDFDEQII